MAAPKPTQKGFLSVGKGHRVYFELRGNPSGIPVVFFHGGPGSCFREKHFKLFDFKKMNVLFFDQRGAGRSTPTGSIKANTTSHLVRDTLKLMKKVGFEKAILVGGSWGSTLALTLAIQHPERVSGLVVSGIFLGTAETIHHLYRGDVKGFFPEEWNRFISMVPRAQRTDPEKYYFKQLNSKNKSQALLFAKEWSRFESSVSRLGPDKKKKKSKPLSIFQSAKIENYYMIHHCFLKPHYILKNAHRLEKMPVSIVHGRYDMLCPVADAIQLHQRIPGSRLSIHVAGHSANDGGAKDKIKKEIAQLVSKQYKRN